MKNLPEKELFSQLEHRLREYTEEPDDSSWDNIASAIHGTHDKNRGFWFERIADGLAIALLFFLLGSAGSSLMDRRQVSNQLADGMSPSKNNETISSNSSQERTQGNNTDINSNADSNAGSADQDVHSSGKNERHVTLHKTIGRKRSDDAKTAAGESSERFYEPGNESSEFPERKSVDQEQPEITQDKNLKPEKQIPDSVDVKKTEPELKKVTDNITQKTDERKKYKKQMQWYFMATPSMAYQKMIPVENDEVVVKGIVPESITSSNRLGISLEVGFQRALFKRMEVYAGLSYYRQNQTIRYEYQKDGPVTVESASDQSFEISPQTEDKQFDYKMRNLGMSAGMLYVIKDGKLKHKAGIGLQYQQGLQGVSGESGYENKSSLYLNYQLSYRLEFPVNKRTTIFFQPTFIHSLYSKEILDEPFELKPYRAGLGLGVVFSF